MVEVLGKHVPTCECMLIRLSRLVIVKFHDGPADGAFVRRTSVFKTSVNVPRRHPWFVNQRVVSAVTTSPSRIFGFFPNTGGVALCWPLGRIRLLGTPALASLFLTVKLRSCFIPFDRPRVASSPAVLLTVDEIFNRPFFTADVLARNSRKKQRCH